MERLIPTLDLVSRKQPGLDDVFTRDERLRMAYVPVIVTESIWSYVDKVLTFCAANRIEQVKKLSRTIKAMRQSYYGFLRASIDSDHLTKAKEAAADFQQRFTYDMTIMWFTINGELKKKHPDAVYQEMRTDALCSILLVRVLKAFCLNVDKDIKERTGRDASTLNPKLKDLDEIMDAYVGDFEIDRTELVRRCEVILRKNMNTIQYKE